MRPSPLCLVKSAAPILAMDRVETLSGRIGASPARDVVRPDLSVRPVRVLFVPDTELAGVEQVELAALEETQDGTASEEVAEVLATASKWSISCTAMPVSHGPKHWMGWLMTLMWMVGYRIECRSSDYAQRTSSCQWRCPSADGNATRDWSECTVKANL